MSDFSSSEWLSPPGETIDDLLAERGWTRAELAERLGRTPKHVNDLLSGKAPISAETAQKLSRVLGSTPEFWLEREGRYRAALERKRSAGALAKAVAWLEELPVGWMVKQGWVARYSDKREQVEACLRYFGVADVEAWRKVYGGPAVAFRSSPSFARAAGPVATWLRRAELDADGVATSPWNESGFKHVLPELRSLTLVPDPGSFMPKLTELCAAQGVAVVLVPAPPGCPISGATRWLTPEKALLVLSLRHKSNDHLWFTFFHESGHLLLHSKKMAFLEGLDGLDESLETEANEFARDELIPPRFARELPSLTSRTAIEDFARRIGVHPGIVVGRLQHDRQISWQALNHLKLRYAWTRMQS